MGTTRLPKVWQNVPGEIPDADDFNANISHVNLVQVNLVSNGNFEIFTAGPSSAPDNWSLNGAGATVARVADPKRGTYAVQLTFGSADAFLSQASQELTAFKGGKVKAWCWVKTSTAGIARIKVLDGIGSSTSGFHTGSGNYELLQVEHDVAAGATSLDIELHVEGAGSALFDGAVLVDFDDITGFMPSENDLVVAASSIPSGSKMAFFQASAPTGWTQDTSQNDAVLRVVSGSGGGTGGADSISSPPTHTHTVGSHTHSTPTHRHRLDFTLSAAGSRDPEGPEIGTLDTDGLIMRDVGSGANTMRRLHNQTEISGGGTSGAGSGSVGSTVGFSPKYVDVIIATKD